MARPYAEAEKVMVDLGVPNLERWARVCRSSFETPEERKRLDALGCSGCSLCKPELFGTKP